MAKRMKRPKPPARTDRAVILSNLGSPDNPTETDVRRYLREFLMDGRVLDVPRPLRWLIVNAFILPKRPRRSAEAYRSIWREDGSPLIAISKRVRDRVDGRLDVPVELAMRYGNPSVESAIGRVRERCGDDLREILFVPLYPHYAMSTVETAVVEARAVAARLAPGVRLDVLPPFFDHPRYIEALVDSASEALAGSWDHLLFSYHGVPIRHLRKTDPTGAHCMRSATCCTSPSAAFKTCYRAQVLRTTQAFVERAKVPPQRYSVAFQSRLGKDTWLSPFTDAEITRLAREGVRRLLVICPAFVADCLETLEEIGIRGRESFEAAGGERLELIPCLNENALWLGALADWCQAGNLG